MDFDNITPRMKNGILLLDYFAEPHDFYRVSNSVDLSLWKSTRRQPLSTSLSKRSKRSSYSGSKYDMDSVSEFKFTKFSKVLSTLDEDDVDIDPGIK